VDFTEMDARVNVDTPGMGQVPSTGPQYSWPKSTQTVMSGAESDGRRAHKRKAGDHEAD